MGHSKLYQAYLKRHDLILTCVLLWLQDVCMFRQTTHLYNCENSLDESQKIYCLFGNTCNKLQNNGPPNMPIWMLNVGDKRRPQKKISNRKEHNFPEQCY
jgi:hypothetical protein